ncbi:unnamed protein product [Triticum turgidum subsp. durum]|uniref:Cation/H+ exchanger transmembrane domain-containing protein n=1 Tax=Triticum turgidum subsp. durum TaxID=4567 RepID=A0A9R0Z8S5_TRITD|nr:unnamed protein product [Triticum turgidum subsp. durum]
MAASSLWDELVVAASTGGSSGTVVSICVFTAVLCLCLVAGHLLEENKWVNESITALIIVRHGVSSHPQHTRTFQGTSIIVARRPDFSLLLCRNSHILRFDEQLFFIYVLPPIIFNAGFQVKKKQFFHNFLTIMSFGVFGVFISVAIVSAALGVIFSSTDTVCTLQVISQDETPRLYSLVFGEGVVNDATSVVLFNAIKNMDITKIKSGAVLKVIGDFLYLFATSTILGATVVIWWAGLMRGAVSIALAYNQVFGFLTRPLISAMLPQHRHREPAGGRSTGSNSPKDEFILPFLGDEDASGSGSGFVQAKRSISMMLERPIHTVHIYWRKFDDSITNSGSINGSKHAETQLECSAPGDQDLVSDKRLSYSCTPGTRGNACVLAAEAWAPPAVPFASASALEPSASASSAPVLCWRPRLLHQ